MNRRVAVLVLLAGLVAGGAMLDRTGSDDDVVVTETPTVDASVFPVANDQGDLSSTWFCAGGTADEEAFADHVITVLNPTDAAMRVTVTAFTGTVAPPLITADVDGEPTEDETTEETDEETDDATPATAGPAPNPVVREVEVAARSRRRLAMTDLVSAPIASALVESSSGGLVVEHEVSSIHGFDAKPCATSASDEWHFAWGTTERDARELLVLFNPFPDDAIVDGRFSTEDGVREPVRFDGLVVPGRSTLAVDLGDDVTRRAEVAASLTVRTGRIVADRIVRIAEEGGARGLTVQLGVPRPEETWVYPDGFTSEDVSETFVVYNPGEALAEVEIEFRLDRPEEHGIPEPVDLSLGPGAHAVVDVGADGRVPTGVPHAAVVRSLNGVGVVAERVLTSSVPDRRGLTVTTGSPVGASEWFFAAGATSDLFDQVLMVFNPDPQVLTELDVFAVVNGQEVPVSGMQGVVVEAGERFGIPLGEQIRRDDLAVLVRSTEPVVVERSLYRTGEDERGASSSIGVPGASGLAPPGDSLEVLPDAGVGDDPGAPPTSVDGDEPPAPPDDVELPEPDETIVTDDPDAEADAPSQTPTSTTEPAAAEEGVPDTAPAGG